MNRFLCEPTKLVLNASTAIHFTETLSNVTIHMLPIVALATNSIIMLVILTNPRLDRSSFSVYVKSMAISDTLVLVFKLLSFENKTSKKYYWPSMCTVLIFLGDASVLLSVWTIVLITIERALVVLFPIHVKNFVSACRARILIIIIAITSLLFSMRILFIKIDSSPEQKKRCLPLPDWQHYRQFNATISELAYCFVPVVIVIIGNCVTLCTVRRAVFRRRQHLTNRVYNKREECEPNESQLMLMLFMVTLMFVVYFVPFTVTSIISRWGLPFVSCLTQQHLEIYLVIRSLCEFLKDLNFCTNFIIYCISGRRFRYAFCSLIQRRRAQSFSSLRYSKNTKRTDALLPQNAPKQCDLIEKQVYEESQL